MRKITKLHRHLLLQLNRSSKLREKIRIKQRIFDQSCHQAELILLFTREKLSILTLKAIKIRLGVIDSFQIAKKIFFHRLQTI